MDRNRGIRWLYGELPGLVGEGVLPPEVAERVRKHYGEPGEPAGAARVALTLSALLGAVLIGGGVILLLAHNWEGLSRPTRTILSLAPLVLAQALAGWCIWRGKDTAPWREGAGTLLGLAVGASIALVSQTYHIPGDFGDFLLAWMLLAVPVVYLLDATLPAALYLVGAVSWAGYIRSERGWPQLFFLLAAVVIPHLWRLWRENRYGQGAIWLSWVMALCVICALGFCLEGALAGIWIVAYSGLFALLYAVGRMWFGEAPSAWQRPFHSAGAMGVAILSFLLTYRWPWEEVGWNHSHRMIHGSAAWIDYTLASALTIASVAFLAKSLRRREVLAALVGAAPAVAVAGYVLAAGMDASRTSMLLYNLYVFVLGVATAVSGVRCGRMGTVNAGMLVLAVLIAARFFDSDLPFLVRGLAFIAVGAGFLATNVILLARRRKGVAP